jgi:pilus assembly protein CpaC
VSSLDFDNEVSAGDIRVPGLDVRRADTTVEMPSGGSLMIAGLLKSDSIKGMTGLPGISKTPILGDLVSSQRFQRDESELIVIVTPYMVEPYAERTRAEQLPKQKSNELAQSFAANIRRIYDVDEELFAQDGQFGYILD